MGSERERPAKRARIDYSDSIEVLVGEIEVKFMVYKGIITERSRFFRAELQHDFKEREEQRVRLSECSVDTFNTYLRWIYDGSLEALRADSTHRSPAHTYAVIHRLVELFVLADHIRDIGLCNTITDRLRACTWWTHIIPLPKTFTLIYTSLPEKSKVRVFFLDALYNYRHGTICDDSCTLYCSKLPCEHPRRHQIGCNVLNWLTENKDTLPSEFFLDLAKGGLLREHRRHPAPRLDPTTSIISFETRERCYYHEHDE